MFVWVLSGTRQHPVDPLIFRSSFVAHSNLNVGHLEARWLLQLSVIYFCCASAIFKVAAHHILPGGPMLSWCACAKWVVLCFWWMVCIKWHPQDCCEWMVFLQKTTFWRDSYNLKKCHGADITTNINQQTYWMFQFSKTN